jgi:hypothetical protein
MARNKEIGFRDRKGWERRGGIRLGRGIVGESRVDGVQNGVI